MTTALRTLAATVAGVVVAFVLVVAVEVFSAVVHPLPQDFGGSSEEMCLHVEHYPTWVLAVVVPAWSGSALAGAWTAKRMGNVISFLIVGLIIVAALVLNISMLPYPLWFKIADLLAVPAAIAAAGRLARGMKTNHHE